MFLRLEPETAFVESLTMINGSDHPVAWGLLLYEIDDVRAHLESLANKMSEAGRIDEEDFAVNIRRAYAHLNRIWHSRNDGREAIPDEDLDRYSQLPADLDPVD